MDSEWYIPTFTQAQAVKQCRTHNELQLLVKDFIP